MSREEELRRERQRQRNKGITSYRWASEPVLTLPFAGDVFVRQADGAVVRVTETKEPELDPQLCETGQRVAYVRGRELYFSEIASRTEVQLTRGAPEGVTRGQSDFNGQEEFDEPSGFWWSPRCNRLAFLR